MRIVSVVGTRPQLIKAAALQPGPARPPRGDPRRHGPALGRGDGRGVLRRARPAPAGPRRWASAAGAAAEQTGADAAGPRADRSAARRPDAVLVYGDTNSTLAGRPGRGQADGPGRPRRGRAALASTGGCPRRSTGSSPTTSRRWLFAPTPTAVANLAAEGIVDGVAQVGDLMQDLAARVVPRGPGSGGRSPAVRPGPASRAATCSRRSTGPRTGRPSAMAAWAALLGRGRDRGAAGRPRAPSGDAGRARRGGRSPAGRASGSSSRRATGRRSPSSSTRRPS